ncbi:MAG TPA: putative glycolipid-binding domain-containing protein [Solirubrobacteraceae bacterium]|nr:putative glycolipid-binding domain-containing protein [Solirubrobacteraceae bacterium]
MTFAPPPTAAAWRHTGARSGFEVVFFQLLDDGWQAEGWTTAVEHDETWAVAYTIQLDGSWATRSARVLGRSMSGARSTLLETDGNGHWLVDGEAAPHLNGCLDVDLESSAMTNAFPVHRLALATGASASCPAAYVRAADLAVERLEQTYARPLDDAGGWYEYAAPAFEFTCRLAYDESGLVLRYPGIATRVHPAPR